MKPPSLRDTESGTFIREGDDENGRWIWKEFTSEEKATRKAAAEIAQKKSADEWALKIDEEQRLAVPKAIEQLRKEAADKLAEASRIEKLSTAFPDLRRQTARWEKVSYSSKSVNSGVTNYDNRHSCGCCNDSPLQIFPYINTEYGKVYSNPSCFTVGERDYHGGDISYSGWDVKMREADIPEALIERVRGLFQNEKSTENDDEDEL